MIHLGVGTPGLVLGRVLNTADRTSELRHRGYIGRRLGPKQMTTDTAVRVTRMVAQEKGMMPVMMAFSHVCSFS